MNNKVKFLRGTSDEYAAAKKDSDTIYFTTNDGKLYIGDKEVSGSDITIDDTLSNTSTNPVQNKVIKAAIDDKADKTIATTDTDGLMSAADKTKLDNADDKYALKSKYGDTTINVGRKAGTDVGEYSTAEGYGTAAIGRASHTEGSDTTASGNYSHAEGCNTTASGIGSHAEGSNCSVTQISIPDRIVTISDVDYTIIGSNAYGINSHAEGAQSFAYGYASHAEGYRTTASGIDSHAEGSNTTASGNASHTSGYHTKALHDNEAAYGKYNESNDNTLFSIGDGTADDARHNAFEITTDGGKLHDKDIATLDNISNSNLLINSDFAINQRGNTGISISSSTWANFFIADRWKLYINNTAPAGTIQRNDDGTITLSMTNGYCDITQAFESYIVPDYYSMSAKVNGEIVTLSGYLYSGKELIDSTKCLVLSEAGFKIRCAQGQTITVEWAKLEKGKTATTFTPPNIAEEMPKCLRYYEKIEYSTTSGLAAVQWKNDVNNCTANIPFFTKRIASPTVTFNDDKGWRFVSNTGVININSSIIQTISANNMGVAFALASATATPSFGWVDKFSVIIEAEL